MEYASEEEKELMKLYEWIDTIPLSKEKKNVARDFSDGALIAEIVKYYYPKMVDVHNYPATSATKQKEVNWNLLALKVFKKLGISVGQKEIKETIECKPNAVEGILMKVYMKVNNGEVSMMRRNKEYGNGSGSGSGNEMRGSMENFKEIEEAIRKDNEEIMYLNSRKGDIERKLEENRFVIEKLNDKVMRLQKKLMQK